MISTNLEKPFKVLSVKLRAEHVQLRIGLSSDKPLRLDILDERNLNLASSSKAKLIVVVPAATKPGLAKQERVIGPEAGLFLILLCCTTVLAIFSLMLPNVWKVAKAKITTLNQFYQVPCRDCRFFTDNHYLRCTVQPSIVLTAQALDCTDYRPLSKR